MNMMVPPKPSSNDAAEGNVVHSIARDMADGATRMGSPGRMSSAFMDTVIDGVMVTKEMTDAALLYANHVKSLMQYAKVFGGKYLGIERRVEIPHIHPTCFGTPDFWMYDKVEKSIHIVDLKYGRRVVEILENTQMLCYMSGVCSALPEGSLLNTVYLTIIQPRAPHKRGPVRTWTIPTTNSNGSAAVLDRIKTSAEEAMGGSPRCVAGPYCGDCASLLTCETNRRANLSIVDLVGELGHSSTNVESLWYELYILERAQKLNKHRVEALRTEVEARIAKGDRIPRYKRQPTTSSLKWNIPHNEVVDLGNSCSVSLEVPKTRTPTQAISDGVPKEMVELFASRGKTGYKLEFDDLKEAKYIFNADQKE